MHKGDGSVDLSIEWGSVSAWRTSRPQWQIHVGPG